jgi:RNA polymerase sigma-70 factor (ECF subfamily)
MIDAFPIGIVDEDFARRFQAGDPDVFAQAIVCVEPRVRRYLSRYANTRDEVDDLIQDTWLLVWRHHGTFRDPTSTEHHALRLLSWILRIAHTAGRNHVRRNRPRLRSIPLESEDCEANASHDGGGTDLSYLWTAIAKLPPRQQEATRLLLRRDLSIAEIARTMHCRPGTVKALLFQARRKLRSLLHNASG